MITVIAIVVVLVGGGLYFWFSGGVPPKVGSCVALEDNGGGDRSGKDMDEVKCSAQNAAYRVAMVKRSYQAECPNGYATYADYGGRKTTPHGSRSYKHRRDSGYNLCLEVNGKVGDCFREQPGSFRDLSKMSCGSGSDRRITKLVSNTDNIAASCGPGERDLSVAYSQPRKTVCMAGT